MKYTITAIAIAAFTSLALSMPVHATQHAGNAVAAADSLTNGEIRKVDRDAKKLTIRHAPLEHLRMPAMTMVFQVKDPSMLDAVKAGDKVKFIADKEGGSYRVTHMEAAQ